MLLPATTGSGLSVLVTSRSARPTTVVFAVAWLLLVFESDVELEAVVLLVILSVPAGAFGLTVATILTVTLVPFAIVPRFSGVVQAEPVVGSHATPVQN